MVRTPKNSCTRPLTDLTMQWGFLFTQNLEWTLKRDPAVKLNSSKNFTSTLVAKIKTYVSPESHWIESLHPGPMEANCFQKQINKKMRL